MAIELLAGVSELCFISFDAKRSEQLCAGIAGELFQFTMRGRTVPVIGNVSNRQPRGNHAKARIEGRELVQKRLQGRITEPTLLWTRRILERLEAIQNQKGSTMRDEFRQPLALLPCRSHPSILVSYPIELG